MSYHQAYFHTSDLMVLPEPKNPVMLKSGGPVMEVFATDGDSVLCEWKEYISDDSKEGGIRVIKINRMSFNKDTLYKLVKYGSVAQ